MSLRQSGFVPFAIRDSRLATFLYRRELFGMRLSYVNCARVAAWTRR